MPVQIGSKAHGFSEPLALLSDCHRRIEMFLGSLVRVGAIIDQPLGDDAHAALASALSYFREAAPKHTADEEQSLFPRLRHVAHPEVRETLAKLDALEQEHRRADHLHAEVDGLGRQALEHGSLPFSQAELFRESVAELASIYKEHIGIEDNLVFPLAGRTLDRNEKAAIAAEMAARRNIRKQSARE